MIKLDGLDDKIIAALREDGRATTQDLGSRFGVAHTTIASRIQRMRKANVMHVRGVSDASAYGLEMLALVGLRVSERDLDSVANDLSTVQHGVLLYVLSATLGRFDLVLAALAPSLEELGNFLDRTIPAISGIRSAETYLAMEVVKFETRWALLGQEMSPLPDGRVDDLDRKILEAFHVDGRTPHREIARRFDVSEGQVRSRVARLVRDKLLHFVAVTDPERLGRSCFAYVSIDAELDRAGEIASELASMEEFAFVARFIGRFGIIGLVALPGLGELRTLLTERLKLLPGVRRTETMQVLQNYRHEARWVRLVDELRP